MRFLDPFQQALVSLAERPVRSALTSLGIIIGVASVFAMLTLGEVAETEMEKAFDTVGARTIYVGAQRPDSRASQSRPVFSFSEADVAALRGIRNVTAVTGTLRVSVKSVAALGDDISATVTGIDLDYPLLQEDELTDGEMISQYDLDSAAPVAVISRGIVKRLFKDQYALGQTLKINGVEFRVKGIVSSGNGDGTSARESYIWIPIGLARQKLVGGDKFVHKHVNSIEVLGEAGANFDQIESTIDQILRQRRNIGINDAPDFSMFSLRSMRAESAKAINMIGYILAAMGSIALLVGGIGVMNVMLMTVSERTSEIGLRMAMGAFESDIMWQFLIESAMLCLLSGFIGIGLGYGVIALINMGLDGDFSINPSLAVGFYSLLAAMFIGVIFGFFPARRAAKMLPIDALRHE
ncbi:ABC transporter permease [Fretibacter rubidus]|uniref:ABC transporter permease n=1 Tax=Fretibacter rubidus TaxID=570162 RepID=UPI00352BC2A8